MKYKVIILVETKRTLAVDLRKQIRDKINELADVLVKGVQVKYLKNKKDNMDF